MFLCDYAEFSTTRRDYLKRLYDNETTLTRDIRELIKNEAIKQRELAKKSGTYNPQSFKPDFTKLKNQHSFLVQNSKGSTINRNRYSTRYLGEKWDTIPTSKSLRFDLEMNKKYKNRGGLHINSEKKLAQKRSNTTTDTVKNNVSKTQPTPQTTPKQKVETATNVTVNSTPKSSRKLLNKYTLGGLGVLGVGAAGYGGYKLLTRNKNKKEK